MINKPERMPFSRDCSSALHLLEHIQQTINNTADAQLQAQTADDINMLISVFSNPILRSIVTVEDSLSELNQQLQQHPSILPVDLYVSPSGELSLNVVPPDEIYDPHYDSKYIQRQEFDDQRVPVAKLSNSSSTDTSTSPQLGTPRSANGTMPPITTQTYAIEFQKAIEESSRGRDIINVQLYKPEGSSLGFSVVGLRSEEKGELGIYVQEIQNTGIAGRKLMDVGV
ncbi:UNVERIFIED_CONTAM: hypothetical protein PYX00_000799 [Menopon gallinae]|uniref:PDZ domain-containing protein n=1 Tax=Menopon gallinae TaxID=328185 RepID=A0AAW2IBQ5_9NEOP